MLQDTTEWLRQPNVAYHQRQFQQVYRSTELFCDWLGRLGLLTGDALRILDVGSGMGANLAYMGRCYPHSQFTGMDLNPQFVQTGNALLRAEGRHNCRLVTGDLYHPGPEHNGCYDGIVSYQTLSWLPDYREALEQMTALGARWIALTSLFYDGDVSCVIRVQDHAGGSVTPVKESFYNVYSLPLVRALLRAHGYDRFEYAPVEMDIDLPRPAAPGMGTYTERLPDGRRLQLSGPLLMPWYFVAAVRS